MIPLPANIPWRLIGWAGLTAAVALAGWRVSVWHDAYGELRATQARLAAEEGCEEGSKCAARVLKAQTDMAAQNAEVVAQYERDIADLRNRPFNLGTVRLCREPDPGPVRVPATAGRTGRDAAGGVLDRANAGNHQAGPDIGPDLEQYAKDCEALSASKRAIVRRDQALAAD